MAEADKEFIEMLESVQRTKKPMTTYPHVILKSQGAGRRGWRVIEAVNKLLDKYDAICEPDFGSAWIYGTVEIRPKPKVKAGKTESLDRDPTPRLSLLKAANLDEVKVAGKGSGLISVNRDTTLEVAVTLMLQHNFSQLPIMSGERQVEGIVSWKSIGRAIFLGKKCKVVSECKDDVAILSYDEPLFSAVKTILDKEVALVRQKDQRITGIVTVTDIGEQFISMAEPFLIIEQIENHIRRLFDQKFSTEDLDSVSSRSSKGHEIDNLSDLSFGDYVQIASKPALFQKLNLNLDRVLFVKQLDDIRKIRNDVMHFDPDGITTKDLDLLRQTLTFFHTLNTTLR